MPGVEKLKRIVDDETATALERMRPGCLGDDDQAFLEAAHLLACDVIKMVVADAVQKANSGHPGGAMSSVDFTHVLFTGFLRASADPGWLDRDRFVLSAGHMSMLLYSLLHLQGRLPLEDLTRFRQLGAPTQGHPIRGVCPGVETSTGPLGQGFGNAVGMALAESYLRTVHGADVVDHWTYVLAGDGDFQEGVFREAAAAAAHLRLGRLVVFYDANGVQLASTTDRTMSEDTGRAFAAYGWRVVELPDGNDHLALQGALRVARGSRDKPTLIIGRTRIARDTTRAGSVETHGAPLGQPVIDEFKSRKGHPGTPFWIPAIVRELYQERIRAGDREAAAWKARLEAFGRDRPELAAIHDLTHGLADAQALRRALDGASAAMPVPSSPTATRVSAGEALAGFRNAAPHLFGGSADLANSTRTDLFEKAVGHYPEATRPGQTGGRAVHYGVREHAMGAITNGLAAHGGFLPFAGTFLVFSDYLRPAIRLAAISRLPSVFVLTHDSIFVGEDGETHQPVEQIASLRLIPHLVVLRPADAHESVAAWRWIIEQASSENPRPVCLILSRQALPLLETTSGDAAEGVSKGGRVVWDGARGELPHIQVMATGSEVHLAVAAA
ncbi:MAG: transketolase, partial [Candidatus Riflebacteria bacterium]|nr:transketolase [Candidatus Riflebacteria bacterium]